MPNPNLMVADPAQKKSNLDVLMENVQETAQESKKEAAKEFFNGIGSAISSDLRNAAGFNLPRDQVGDNISDFREHAARKTVGRMSTDNCNNDDCDSGVNLSK